MHFVYDQLATDKKICVLTVVDTRATCLCSILGSAIGPRTSFGPWSRSARGYWLPEDDARRPELRVGFPRSGPVADAEGVTFDFGRPGKADRQRPTSKPSTAASGRKVGKPTGSRRLPTRPKDGGLARVLQTRCATTWGDRPQVPISLLNPMAPPACHCEEAGKLHFPAVQRMVSEQNRRGSDRRWMKAQGQVNAARAPRFSRFEGKPPGEAFLD